MRQESQGVGVSCGGFWVKKGNRPTYCIRQ
nr:MAG TPA: hypothetical protein [Bacteriophage sp.]